MVKITCKKSLHSNDTGVVSFNQFNLANDSDVVLKMQKELALYLHLSVNVQLNGFYIIFHLRTSFLSSVFFLPLGSLD